MITTEFQDAATMLTRWDAYRLRRSIRRVRGMGRQRSPMAHRLEIEKPAPSDCSCIQSEEDGTVGLRRPIMTVEQFATWEDESNYGGW